MWEWCLYMGMEVKSPDVMGRRRALLTDSERELLTADDLDDENRRYQAVSRIRNKIEDELPQDVAILEENHSQLLAELRDVACDEVDVGQEGSESAPAEYIITLETHIEEANKALDNGDPDAVRRHVRAAGEAVGDVRLLDEGDSDDR